MITLKGTSTDTSLTITLNTYKNPISTLGTEDYEILVYQSAAKEASEDPLDSYTESCTGGCSTLSAAAITATISSDSVVVGAEEATFSFEFTSTLGLVEDGYLTVEFPEIKTYSTTYPSLLTETSTCTAVSTNLNTLTCALQTDKMTMKISNTVSSATTGTFQFTISDVENPYTTKPLSGFVLRNYHSDGGVIEEDSDFSISGITESADIITAVVSVSSSSIVEEESIFTFRFQSPVPLSEDCEVKITFPSNVVLATSGITRYSGKNAFKSASVSSVTGQVVTIDGCPTGESYSASTQHTVVLKGLTTNPPYVKDTDNFSLEVLDVDGSSSYVIAALGDSTDLFLDASLFETGDITTLTLTAVTTSEVQSETSFQFSIKPAHSLPSDNVIEIVFPSDLPVANSACSVTSATSPASTSATCSFAGSTLTINDIFGSSGTFTKGGSAFTFTLSTTFTNPDTASAAGTLTVNTYAVISGVNYSVDSSELTAYTSTPGVLTAVLTSVVDAACYEEAVYTFTLTPKKTIPSGGIITITFPDEIEMLNSAVTTCSVTKSSGTSPFSDCTIDSTSPVTISIPSAFATKFEGDGVETVVVQIGEFLNPRSTEPTSSFAIALTDSAGNIVEETETGVTATMDTPSTLKTFGLSPDSPANSAETSYEISLIAVSPLQDSDELTLTFPSEMSVTSPTCTAGTNLDSVSCSVTGQVLTIVFEAFSTTIESGGKISVTVSGIMNPPSNFPSSAFSDVYIKTTGGTYFVSQYSTTLTVTNTQLATITDITLSQTEESFGEETTYKFEFETSAAYSAGAAWKIKIPSVVTVGAKEDEDEDTEDDDEPEVTICNVIYKGVTTAMKCTYSSGLREISLVPDGTEVGAVALGDTVTLQLGPFVNPDTPFLENESFEITTFVDSDFQYAYDEVTSGVEPAYLCNAPCKNCSPTDKDLCRKCFTPEETEEYLFYYLDQSANTCVEQCDDGYFGDSNGLCRHCYNECQTCSNYATCTSCDPDGSTPFFFDDQCWVVCPDGSYSKDGACHACAETCQTCETDPTTCLSCDRRGKDAIYKYFYEDGNQCLTKCGDGLAVKGLTCETCVSPCSTCVTPFECLSCENELYRYHSTCVDECPVGAVLRDNQCLDCDKNCAFCSESEDSACLFCNDGWVLYEDSCYTQCPEGTDLYLDFICISRADASGDGWGRPALAYFPFTGICLGLLAICIYSEWRERKSSFLSNTIAFWGLLELSALLTQLALAYEMEIDTSPTALVFIGAERVAETKLKIVKEGGRLLQEVYDSPGDRPRPIVFAATFIAVAFLLISNLAYFFLFKHIYRKDEGIMIHQKAFPKWSKAIYYLSILVNFKTANLYYGYLFGRPQFDVQFSDRKDFHKYLNYLTALQMVTVLLPVAMADIAGLFLHSWGTQYYVSCIDTLIIVSALTVFSIIEYKMDKEDRGLQKPTRIDDVSAQNLLEEGVRKRLGLSDGQNLESFLQRKKKDRQQKEDKKLQTEVLRGDQAPEEDGRRLHSESAIPVQENDPKEKESHLRKFKRQVTHQARNANLANMRAHEINPFPVSDSEDGGEHGRLSRRRKPRGRGFKERDIDADDEEMIADSQRVGLLQGETLDQNKDPSPEGDRQVTGEADKDGLIKEGDGPISQQDVTLRNKELEEELGNTSDDDEEQRILNLANPEKRRFNEHDILGDLDRDGKGDVQLLTNDQGQLVDKQGKRVNPRGFLIDSATGDVLENENLFKVFDSAELDERGDLPPPFNLERFNFNPHDVRGYFERDEKGAEIVPASRRDKLGRMVNATGFLVDEHGHLVDKRGRRRLHRKQLEEDGGMPPLHTYDGERFNCEEVIGALDKDRNGNIIIRRDAKNQTIDKRGRLVNRRGYLVDKGGNVIDKAGKVMFRKDHLSEDEEIPKIFSFMKFNQDSVSGRFERDPGGFPILNKVKRGKQEVLEDQMGRRCNEQGYLVDEAGNVLDARGYVVFKRNLLDSDGEIPKVFRSGMLRRDTQDDFEEIMKDIEVLEQNQLLQEQGVVKDQRASRRKKKRRPQQEFEQIEEEEEEIMKEIESLAQEEAEEEDVAPFADQDSPPLPAPVTEGRGEPQKPVVNKKVKPGRGGFPVNPKVVAQREKATKKRNESNGQRTVGKDSVGSEQKSKGQESLPGKSSVDSKNNSKGKEGLAKGSIESGIKGRNSVEPKGLDQGSIESSEPQVNKGKSQKVIDSKGKPLPSPRDSGSYQKNSSIEKSNNNSLERKSEQLGEKDSEKLKNINNSLSQAEGSSQEPRESIKIQDEEELKQRGVSQEGKRGVSQEGKQRYLEEIVDEDAEEGEGSGEELEGGCTPEASDMGITPTDFNAANGRFNASGEQQQIAGYGLNDQNPTEEDFELDSNGALPKRRKKSRKSGRPALAPVGDRELKMAEAYGGQSTVLRQNETRKRISQAGPPSKTNVHSQPMKQLNSSYRVMPKQKPPPSRDSQPGTSQTQRKERLQQNNFVQNDSFNNRSKAVRHAEDIAESEKARRLIEIANSVNGFYKQPSLNSISARESNLASVQRALPQPLREDRPLNRDLQAKTGQQSVMSDWEIDSQLSELTEMSGQPGRSQRGKQKRVRGLENIYLQRLEPSKQGGKNWNTGKNRVPKAKFRVTTDRLPELEHQSDDDDIASLVSQKFGSGVKRSSLSRRRDHSQEEELRPNIFSGNFGQYVPRKRIIDKK